MEKHVGLAPEHGGAHFAGGWADFAGEKFFVLEVDVDWRDEFLAIEKSADGDFDAVDAALELEDLNFIGESFLVGFEHANNIFAVFFFADEEAALDVLGFTAGLNDVTVGIFLNKLNGRVKRIKILIRNDGDAGGLQLFLTERTIIFEAVRVGRAADDGLARGTERLSLAALAESVVKDDDVGPFGVLFPVFGFGYKPVGDVALFFVVDVVTNIVAFLQNLPGDVTDETGKRDEEEFAFVHERASGVSFDAGRMMAL